MALQDNLLCLAVVPNIYIPSSSLLFTNGSLETFADFQASVCEPIHSLMGCRCGASTVFAKDEPLKLQGSFGHLSAAKLSNLLAERNPAFRRAQSLFSFHGMILMDHCSVHFAQRSFVALGQSKIQGSAARRYLVLHANPPRNQQRTKGFSAPALDSLPAPTTFASNSSPRAVSVPSTLHRKSPGNRSEGLSPLQ